MCAKRKLILYKNACSRFFFIDGMFIYLHMIKIFHIVRYAILRNITLQVFIQSLIIRKEFY